MRFKLTFCGISITNDFANTLSFEALLIIGGCEIVADVEPILLSPQCNCQSLSGTGGPLDATDCKNDRNG